MTSYPPPPPPAYGAPGSPAPAGKVRLRGRVPRILGWIFLGVGIVAIVVGGVLAATRSFGAVDGFQRVAVSDRSGEINIDRTGKWVIYYEDDSVTNDITTLPTFAVEVRGPSGQAVTVEPYRELSDGKITKLPYDHDGHHGVAARQFDAPVKGTYRVLIAGSSDAPGADLAFGEDILDSGLIAGGVLVLIGILLVIAAIVLLIVGYVKRSRHKRELATATYGPPPGYGPPGYGPPTGYGQQGGYGPPPGQQGGFGPPPGQPGGFGPPPGQQGGFGDEPGQGPSLQK